MRVVAALLLALSLLGSPTPLAARDASEAYLETVYGLLSGWEFTVAEDQLSYDLEKSQNSNGQKFLSDLSKELSGSPAPAIAVQTFGAFCYRDFECWAMRDALAILTARERTADELRRVVEYNQALIEGIRLANDVAAASLKNRSALVGSSEGARIYSRALPAIVLRSAPRLAPRLASHPLYDQEVFQILLRNETRREDELNRIFFETDNLSSFVTTSTVPPDDDILIHVLAFIQHADHDPVFQFSALRTVIEPAYAAGRVSAGSFALLADRVSLKLDGTQKFGTQMMCRDGALVPQGSQSSQAIENNRLSIGLSPLEDYVQYIGDNC